MLTEFTGQTFERSGVYNLVKKLQKRFLVIDTVTGEEKVEFRGVQVLVFLSFFVIVVVVVVVIVIVIVQVSAQGLGLSQLWRGPTQR